MKHFTIFLSTESLVPLATFLQKLSFQVSPPIKYQIVNENKTHFKTSKSYNIPMEMDIQTTKDAMSKSPMNKSPTKGTKKAEPPVFGENKTITVDEYHDLMDIITNKNLKNKKKIG